ncbi:MAG: hypothetical protein AAGE61_04710 [Pseudomonadota bacterium]
MELPPIPPVGAGEDINDFVNDIKSKQLAASIDTTARRLQSQSITDNTYDNIIARNQFTQERYAGDPDAQANFEAALDNATPVLSSAEAFEIASGIAGVATAKNQVTEGNGLSADEAAIIAEQFNTNDAFRNAYLSSAVETFGELGFETDEDFVTSNVLGLIDQAQST